MSGNRLFTEPSGTDFLVVNDYDPPLGATLLPEELGLTRIDPTPPDLEDPEWGSFVDDLSDPALDDNDDLQRIRSGVDPFPEPAAVPEQAPAPRAMGFVERMRVRTRRLYAEGLPVVFGPAPVGTGRLH